MATPPHLRLLTTGFYPRSNDISPMPSPFLDSSRYTPTTLVPSLDSAPQSVLIAASSPIGMIQVLSYTPTEGECGVPISARINFNHDSLDAVHVRLVVGNKAVATKVRELNDARYGKWQLDSAAPPYDKDHAKLSKVLLSVQALGENNNILDSVTFGEFLYWVDESSSPHLLKAHKGYKRPRGDSLGGESAPGPLHISTQLDGPRTRRRALTIPSSPPVPDRVPPPKTRPRKPQLHRRTKSQSLMRTKQAAGDTYEEVYHQTPILDLVTPLESICHDWDPSEFAAGRRLVRFHRSQEGRRLIVSCEPIRQEQYRESDAVISCIYREETDTCFVTSVDIIYLLERLTDDDFPVEEKNRIRRNLEGLRPTCVSKHKPGFEPFFQRIMEFPDPKPRNIEKDLKVFEWTLLGQALDKILSKYSIYTTSPVDFPTPLPNEPVLTDSPTLSGAEMSMLEYPHNAVYAGTGKYQMPQDELIFMPTAAEVPDFYSTNATVSSMNSSPLSPYGMYPAMFASDMSASQESDSSSGSWVSDSHVGGGGGGGGGGVVVGGGIPDYSTAASSVFEVDPATAAAYISGTYPFQTYEELEMHNLTVDHGGSLSDQFV